MRNRLKPIQYIVQNKSLIPNHQFSLLEIFQRMFERLPCFLGLVLNYNLFALYYFYLYLLASDVLSLHVLPESLKLRTCRAKRGVGVSIFVFLKYKNMQRVQFEINKHRNYL